MIEEADNIAFRRWCSERCILLTWEQICEADGQQALCARGAGRTYFKCLLALFEASRECCNVVYRVPDCQRIRQAKTMLQMIAKQAGVMLRDFSHNAVMVLEVSGQIIYKHGVIWFETPAMDFPFRRSRPNEVLIWDR